MKIEFKIRFIPLIIIPLVLFVLTAMAFIFFVPPGGDLISSQGDYYLGQTTVDLLVFCIVLDTCRWLIIKRYKTKRQ